MKKYSVGTRAESARSVFCTAKTLSKMGLAYQCTFPKRILLISPDPPPRPTTAVPNMALAVLKAGECPVTCPSSFNTERKHYGRCRQTYKTLDKASPGCTLRVWQFPSSNAWSDLSDYGSLSEKDKGLLYPRFSKHRVPAFVLLPKNPTFLASFSTF